MNIKKLTGLKKIIREQVSNNSLADSINNLEEKISHMLKNIKGVKDIKKITPHISTAKNNGKYSFQFNFKIDEYEYRILVDRFER